MRKVLFTSAIFGIPPIGGPELRVLNSLRALLKIAEVDVLIRKSLDTSERERLSRELHLLGVQTVWFISDESKMKFRRSVAITLDSWIRKNVSSFERRAAQFIVTKYRELFYDAIWLGYGNTSFTLLKYLRAALPSAFIVSDTDSVWSRFILRSVAHVRARRRPTAWLLGHLKQLEERRALSLASVTTAVSEIDQAAYREMSPEGATVACAYNVLDLRSYHVSEKVSPDLMQPSVCLAGSFGHPDSAMDVGAKWLLDEVWPLVLHRHPESHLYIVGRDSSTMWGWQESDNVHVVGEVRDAIPFIAHATVVVVPLQFESGTRFKILEAGALSKAVVSTSLGAEGLLLRDGQDLLIADTPKEFATAIGECFSGGARVRLGESLNTVVQNHYGLEVLVRQTEEILQLIPPIKSRG